MKVVLVNPPRQDGVPAVREERHEFRLRQSVLYPLSLLQTAALLEEDGHPVGLVDANAAGLSSEEAARAVLDHRPDLVVTRFTTDGAARDLAFTRHLPSGLPVVARSRVAELGGLDLAFLERFPEVHAFCRGELEAVVPVLAARGDLEGTEGLTTRAGGRLGGAPRVEDWGSVPLPAFHLLPDLSAYGRRNRPRRRPFAMLESSRGCSFGCRFCIEARTRWRARSAERVAGDMEALHERFGVGHVQFQDETFTLRRERVLELSSRLCRTRLPRHLTWECNTRPDLVDPEVLRAMARAGCRRVHLGVESLDAEVLRRSGRGMGPEAIEKAAWSAWRAGLAPGASVILGLPGDTAASIRATVRRLRRLPLAGCQFNLAFPYPGTALHREALEKGWLREGEVEWADLDPTVPALHRPDLPSRELAALRQSCYRQYYLHPMRVVSALGLLRSAADLDELLRRLVNLAGKALRGFRHDRGEWFTSTATASRTAWAGWSGTCTTWRWRPPPGGPR